jgi:hypothetical protein
MEFDRPVVEPGIEVITHELQRRLALGEGLGIMAVDRARAEDVHQFLEVLVGRQLVSAAARVVVVVLPVATDDGDAGEDQNRNCFEIDSHTALSVDEQCG